MTTSSSSTCSSTLVVLSAVLAFSMWLPVRAQQVPTPLPASCTVSGKILGGATPIPGVSIAVRQGERLISATSTAVDGTYRVQVPAGGTYQMTMELTGFASGARDVGVASPPCDLTADFGLVLASRVAGSVVPPATTVTPVVPPAGRGAAASPAGQRFSTLDVQANATAAAALDVAPPDRQAELAALAMLPPGFTTEINEAVTINGTMASIDRGMMNDRLGAITRGEFDPTTGTFTGGLDPTQEGFGPAGGFGQGGRQGGRGMGPGGRGGAPGDFAMGGRGRGQRLFQFTTNYSFSGSALNSDPYQLRPGSTTSNPPYHRQNFGATVGGPVILPGVYNGTRRTNFTATYAGNRGANLFDQYASRAERRLLTPVVADHPPGHRATVPRQSDSTNGDQHRVTGVAAVHSAAQPRRHQSELSHRDHDRFEVRCDHAADHACLHTGRWPRRRWRPRRGR
ncbi:MAG: carboxypeptidase regulatory-like domain-containing protein [Acidobacteria bacterium]|nr:carboxypeptidase regulatory-like domain-containing protein [Acidobacteriota bacterium]